MFRIIVSRITESAIKNGVLPKEDQVICEYGLQQLFTILLNVFTAILIGYFFGLVLESVVALLVFIPLRTYAGGFHFENPIPCYVVSSLMISIQMLFVKYTHLQYSMLPASISLVVLITNLAPIASKNKPLSKKEVIRYKKTTWRILIVIEIVMLIGVFMGQFAIGRSVLFTMFITALLQLVAR